MSRERAFFLGFFPILFITALQAGCVHTNDYRYSEAPLGEVLLNPNPHFEDASFSRWTDPLNETGRIRYLLSRIATSDNRFIRNGKPYDGKKARQWFLYKMSHWTSGVDTAEGFVSRVASFSKRTGQPYLVESIDGRTYSLGSVLKNELLAFDAQQTKARAKDISLSPTSVATTAVAAATTTS